MERIDEAVGKLADGLERLVTEHGAEGVELALAATQLDAAKWAMVSLLMIGAFGTATALIGRAALRCTRLYREEDDWDGDKIVGTAMLWVLTAIAGFVATWGAIMTAPPVYWAAALGSPELLMAQRVLTHAGM